MLISAQLALVQPCHEICLAAVFLCSRVLGCLPFWEPVRTWHQRWQRKLQELPPAESCVLGGLRILRWSQCTCNKDSCLCQHYLGRQVPSAVRPVAFPRSCQGSHRELPSFITRSFSPDTWDAEMACPPHFFSTSCSVSPGVWICLLWGCSLLPG